MKTFSIRRTVVDFEITPVKFSAIFKKNGDVGMTLEIFQILACKGRGNAKNGIGKKVQESIELVSSKIKIK